MKKFISTVETMVLESLKGMAAVHSGIIGLNEKPLFVYRRHHPVDKKVALISGGGSGHEPLHNGYVGMGMLDAACPGEIFTAPTPDQMVAASKKVEKGAGVLFIVKNYAGDCMNFEIASEMLDLEHLSLVISDEAVLSESNDIVNRRAIAGAVIIEKMVGAMAEEGADLKTCYRLGQRLDQGTRSMGVALTSCILPAANKPTFCIGETEIEMGVGIHGEPGRQKIEFCSAAEIVDQMMATIVAELAPKPGSKALLFVNGLGGTPLMELYLVYHLAKDFCQTHQLQPIRSLVGNYTTALEMAGCSITLSLLDDELIRLWDAPVHTPALRWGR